MKEKTVANIITWSNRLLKALGLWLVISMVVWVTTHKLNSLREYKQSLPTTVTNVDEKMRQLDC